VGAVLKKSADGKSASLTANPGFLLGGEVSRLLDRGNQKFLKTSKLEVPRLPTTCERYIFSPKSCANELALKVSIMSHLARSVTYICMTA